MVAGAFWGGRLRRADDAPDLTERHGSLYGPGVFASVSGTTQVSHTTPQDVKLLEPTQG